MSKRSSNKKKRSKKKVAKKRTDLRSVLQSIYHDNVSLETTCCHSCECCKVAMPQINYSEFVQIVTTLWNEKPESEILDLISTSLEYFFRYEYEKWGMESLVKPCMFLKEDRCTVYVDRPLNCRLYGLWPEDDYEDRVQKFAAAYEVHGLKRDDLPLNRQCAFVKRVDNETELTAEVIQSLFDKLDKLDATTGNFTPAQIRQKENYRTFHDWLLLKVFGEEELSRQTAFVLAASKETMEALLSVLKEVLMKTFKNNVPKLDTLV